jgi:DNA-binding GntR family transcriptional regulator
LSCRVTRTVPAGRQDLQVERIAPPPAIAQRLKLDPEHDVCVVRRHIRYIDDRPAIISDDFFDERIVRGTELAEPGDTTRDDILKEAGYEQVYATVVRREICDSRRRGSRQERLIRAGQTTSRHR